MSYVVEIGYYPSGGPAAKLYYSSGKGWTTKATDTPANTHIAGRLNQPYYRRADLFSKATTYGAVDSGGGNIVLNNGDGALDVLLDYALDGREVVVYQGEEGAAYPADFELVGRAQVETLQLDGNTITLTLRDKLQSLDVPLLPSKYAGNNSLPAGVEGNTELKDTRKPRLYGTVLNISPVLVNTNRYIYQASDQTGSISAVYVRGVALSAGSTYSDAADMQANAPSSGQYRVLATSGGLWFRLGTLPDGTVTCDATTTETKAASLVSQVAQDAGISSGDISSADVSAANSANSSAVGVYVTGDMTALEVMNDLAAAIGMGFYFDSLNDLRMLVLTAPGVSPVLSIHPARITSIRLISTADTDKGIPPWAVRLGYARNYTVQNDLVGAAITRLAWTEREYRTAVSEDSSVLTAHLRSEPMVVDTCLVTQANAETEAARRLTLYKVGRDMFEFGVQLEPADIAQLELGMDIEFTYPRYGLDSGEVFRLLGFEINAELGQAKLRVWG